jgi:nucleotide-binding universal stress UspA family protein
MFDPKLRANHIGIGGETISFGSTQEALMSALGQIQHQKQKLGFKRVLIATDFSDASRQALAYATAIARRYSAALSVVHAIVPEPRPPIPLEAFPPELNRRRLEAEREMKNLGEETRIDDLNHHFLLERGRVWDVLGSVIQRDSIDLLVLGTHGRGGLKKLALRSVAEEVLRLAPCPVLTIGPQVPPAISGPIEFERILFATDFSAAANKALPYALSLAEDCKAKLVLLHMVPPMPVADLGRAAYGPPYYAAEEYTNWQRATRDESMRKLRNLIPPGAQLAAEPEYIAALDFLPEGILELAAAQRIDLIVMGANRTTSPRIVAHVPWALTHEVICHAKCPVLTCLA